MGLNVLVFLYSVFMSRSLQGITRLEYELLVDGGLFGRAWLVEEGVGKWIGVDVGEYYRLITSAFLHDGIFHLAFNMYALWLLGQLLEATFGTARFLTLYVSSLLGGAFGVMLVSPESPTVGASGAVYGLLGAMVLIQKVLSGKLWRSNLGILLIVNLALTLLVPRVSIGGHIGGLAAGLFMGSIMLLLEARGAPSWVMVVSGTLLSGLLVAGSIIAAGQ